MRTFSFRGLKPNSIDGINQQVMHDRVTVALLEVGFQREQAQLGLDVAGQRYHQQHQHEQADSRLVVGVEKRLGGDK